MCPCCLENRKFKKIVKEEEFSNNGKTITIDALYLACVECGEQILDPINPDENFIKAYTKLGIKPKEIE